MNPNSTTISLLDMQCYSIREIKRNNQINIFLRWFSMGWQLLDHICLPKQLGLSLIPKYFTRWESDKYLIQFWHLWHLGRKEFSFNEKSFHIFSKTWLIHISEFLAPWSRRTTLSCWFEWLGLNLLCRTKCVCFSHLLTPK